MADFLRVRPQGRATNASVGTSGAAFAIPNTGTSQVKVKVSADAYVGVGSSGTPPAASASNSAYLEANEQEVWTLDPTRRADSHVYVWAVSGTLVAKISFYA